jgi:transcriptional regulator with XRE-family HTH domain
MSDVRIGTRFRAVRRRLGLRQTDVARRARVSPTLVSRIERGQLGSIAIARIRRVAEILEIRLELQASWRGGELERIVNARHGAMHDVALRLFESLTGWETTSEVSFWIRGERGVIDIVAWHAATRTLLIIELKTELVDPQELVGTMDRRRRLAFEIAAQRGWRPRDVGVWVAFADTSTNRRHVNRHRRLLRAAFPADGRAIRHWLRGPAGPIAALSFLSLPQDTTVIQDLRSPRRVRRGRSRTSRAAAA